MDDIVFLIDFDGTLADTSKIWRDAEYAFLGSHDLAWSDEASHRLLGGNMDVVSRVVFEETGKRFTIPELITGMQQPVQDALLAGIPWMPGAERLLRELRASKNRSALVTSSYMSVVGPLFEALEFSPFEMLIVRDDVGNPKPDPEPYVLAMQRMGVRDSRAIALEDSPNGVRSALGAGCYVLGIGEHIIPDAYAPGRLRHVDSLDGLDIAAIIALFPELDAAKTQS